MLNMNGGNLKVAVISSANNCQKKLIIPIVFIIILLFFISAYINNRFTAIRLNGDTTLRQLDLISKEANKKIIREPTRRRSGPIVIASSACGHEIYDQLIVLIKSAVIMSKSDLHFIILTDVLKEKIIDELSRWPNSYMKRVTYEIKAPQFPNKKWELMFRPCSTARLFLPDILPETDAAMYLDADTLFLSEVEKLWNYFEQMSSTQMIGLVREMFNEKYGWFHMSGFKLYKNIPFLQPVPYNAGVLLMNLTRLRANDWQTNVMRIYDDYMKKLNKTADQGIINIYCYERPTALIDVECKWNYNGDHCMYGREMCDSSQQSGVGLLHHHSNFPEYNDQSLYTTYRAFRNFVLTDNQTEDIGKIGDKILRELSRTKISKCKGSFDLFLLGTRLFHHYF